MTRRLKGQPIIHPPFFKKFGGMVYERKRDSFRHLEAAKMAARQERDKGLSVRVTKIGNLFYLWVRK